MQQSDFNRKIVLSTTNKRVETNIGAIIRQLTAAGYTQTEIADRARVSPGSIKTWLSRGRANAASIDRLIASVVEQPKKIDDENTPNLSTLWQHIEAIKEMGFNVSLTPIEQA